MNAIDVYVGDDEKLHFVDAGGADTALPFKKDEPWLRANILGFYDSRCSYVNGGFYVKNGLCKFQITLKANKALSSGISILNRFPQPKETYTTEKVIFNQASNPANAALLAVSVSSNEMFSFEGEFKTDAVDEFYYFENMN